MTCTVTQLRVSDCDSLLSHIRNKEFVMTENLQTITDNLIQSVKEEGGK